MISLKRLKTLMISLKPWWMFQISLKPWWMFQISLKNTPALRARGLHTRSSWSSVIRKRNETKTFELMAFLKKRSQLSKMKTTEKMQNFQKWNLSALVATKSFTLDGDKVCHVFVTFSWRQNLAYMWWRQSVVTSVQICKVVTYWLARRFFEMTC